MWVKPSLGIKDCGARAKVTASTNHQTYEGGHLGLASSCQANRSTSVILGKISRRTTQLSPEVADAQTQKQIK